MSSNAATTRSAKRVPVGSTAPVPVRRVDGWLVGVTIALVVVGILMVFDASYVKAAEADFTKGDPFYFLKRHLVWAVIGAGAFLTGLRIGYWRLEKWAVPLLLVSIFFLVLVLIPGVGYEAGGAQRWLRLGPAQFQPSEVAKMALVIYTAGLVARNPRRIKVLDDGFLQTIVPMVVVAGLIVVEPDMGTTIAACVVVVALLFVGGAERKHVWGLLLAGLVAGAALIAMHPFRVRRLTAFLDPWADPEGSGYQVLQGLIALGSGGPWGVGLGESRAKWHYLPGEHTDFIFAIIGEEFGLFGTLAIVALFALLVRRGFVIAQKCRNPFGHLLALGFTLIIGIQAVVNMGVVAAVLPNTGVPLPMISFGGTSLILTLFALGVVADISRRPALPWDTEPYDDRSHGRRDRGAHLSGPEYRRGTRQTRRADAVYRQR